MLVRGDPQMISPSEGPLTWEGYPLHLRQAQLLWRRATGVSAGSAGRRAHGKLRLGDQCSLLIFFSLPLLYQQPNPSFNPLSLRYGMRKVGQSGFTFQETAQPSNKLTRLFIRLLPWSEQEGLSSEDSTGTRKWRPSCDGCHSHSRSHWNLGVAPPLLNRSSQCPAMRARTVFRPRFPSGL